LTPVSSDRTLGHRATASDSEIVRLSEGYLARIPIVKTAAPYLVELRALTKATVLVALLRGDHTASTEPTLGSVRTGVPTAPLPQ
jgi:hypothetical protein